MPGARIERGERVTLRTVEEEDVPFIQRASANPGIRYPLGSPLRSREQIEDRDREATDRFLVCLDDDAGPGQPDEGAVRRVGVVSVEDADWKRPELGYWLVSEVHGEGYGTEAVALVVEFVFRSYETPAIGAGAFASNDASQGLLESLGFTREGRRRKYMFVDGKHRDMVQYGLLREEWREQTDA